MGERERIVNIHQCFITVVAPAIHEIMRPFLADCLKRLATMPFLIVETMPERLNLKTPF